MALAAWATENVCPKLHYCCLFTLLAIKVKVLKTNNETYDDLWDITDCGFLSIIVAIQVRMNCS